MVSLPNGKHHISSRHCWAGGRPVQVRAITPSFGLLAVQSAGIWVPSRMVSVPVSLMLAGMLELVSLTVNCSVGSLNPSYTSGTVIEFAYAPLATVSEPVVG